jgi:choline dehydrogenase-like flavoprotein
LLFRSIPDLDLLDAQRTNTDPNWVSITLRGIGEMRGDRTTPLHDPARSWLDLSPYEADEFGIPRAYVHLALTPEDQATWAAMDHAAVGLARLVAGSPGAIEYLYDSRWTSTPFPIDRPFPEWHRGLGSTYHEAGTLWMGDNSANSITDPTGRLHHVANLWVCDQALFPTVGSVNPAITGMTLAKLVAEQHP